MKVFSLVVRDEAQDETELIRLWYEEQSPGLGERFVTALEAAYKQIRISPHSEVRKEIYRYGYIKGFPSYRIVYVIDGDVITVYQVRHTSRKPHPTFGP